MRIRSTKPEFWRSERIASVDWDARLVLKGLESYVDDNGVGRDDLVLIVADLFARDLAREPSRTLARVSEALTHLNHVGLIHRYEVEGTDLLFLSWWESFQRVDKATRGRFPRPDGTFNYGESHIAAPLANPREPSRTLAPGTGEQGNRGTEEQGRKDSFEASSNPTESNHPLALIEPPTTPRPDGGYSPAFEEFWSTYPRHEGKRKALAAWTAAIRRARPPQILDGAARYRDDPNREPGYTAHATTWLNRDGWNDDPIPARNATSTETPTDRINRMRDTAFAQLDQNRNTHGDTAGMHRPPLGTRVG